MLDFACRTGRRLLTFDVDFGELVFSCGVAAPAVIVYFRIHPLVIEKVLQLVLGAVWTRLTGTSP
ncbi:MAG: hypothetical protein JZU52_17295 [Lamprocystis purpurea]|nr:hypothetical protein [Lamprocystis purpurea]